MYTIERIIYEDDTEEWRVYCTPNHGGRTLVRKFSTSDNAMRLVHYLNGGDPTEVFISGGDA